MKKKKKKETEKEIFKETDVKYPGMFHPVIFMDDLNKVSSTRDSAQLANERIENMLEEKLLDLNSQKTCFLILGN